MNVDSYNKYIANEMLKAQQGGNVNLFDRPQIPSSILNDRGWDAGNGTATVFSSTYGNGPYGNFTPIARDQILSPMELDAYANGVMNGAPDDLGLQIGGQSEGLEEALNKAEMVHRLQEAYYNRAVRDMYSK